MSSEIERAWDAYENMKARYEKAHNERAETYGEVRELKRLLKWLWWPQMAA